MKVAVFICKERSMQPSMLCLWQLDEKEKQENRKVKIYGNQSQLVIFLHLYVKDTSLQWVKCSNCIFTSLNKMPVLHEGGVFF